MCKKFLCIILSLIIVMSSFNFYTSAQDTPLNEVPINNTENTTNLSSTQSYFDYYNTYKSLEAPSGFIDITGDSFVAAQDASKAVSTVSEKKVSIIGENNDWCEWSFEVIEEGRYGIWLDYYPLVGTGKDILLSLNIDGKSPYFEANRIQLPRVWADLKTNPKANFEQDLQGNDIRPKQVEAPSFINKALADVQGLYSEPYFLHLTAGKHTIRLNANREAIAISNIQIGNQEKTINYKDYLANFSNQKVQGIETFIKQAEDTFQKTSSLLYPTYDRSDVATEPNAPGVVRLNTIGQTNWSKTGDSISWKVDVSKEGLYKIAFRARQNYNQGMKSYRTLMINGKIPFAEAEKIAFDYKQDWYIKTLGDESPYYVYLKSGDVLTLSCNSNDISEILRNVRQGLLDLNAVYRKIIAITSTQPDIYRNYSLDKQIPDLEKNLKSISAFLDSTADRVAQINGTRGSQASVLDYVTKILNELAYNPEIIQERLSTLKGAIDSLGSLVLTLGQQPLELDYIAFIPEGANIPKARAGFFKNMDYSIRQFIISFYSDYSLINKETKKGTTVKVWVSTGRDQAQIIKNLIKNSFTKQTGIEIDLNMVDTGQTLIKATLAGKGPDAALMAGLPLDLACRGAVVNLNNYDLTDITNQFLKPTLIPLQYNGGLYALPEIETFDVLFYRIDVFADLGLKVPKTWEEFYIVMEKLQKSNLNVGIPEINSLNMGVSDGIAIFDKFLLQSKGAYYNEAKTESLLNSSVAYDAFEKWVKLYQQYGLDREFNFYSRFRTGEMPLAIQNYSVYNQLMQAAPELQGLWSIALIPGTKQKDGSIDRSESGNVSGCIMLNSAVEKGIDKETIKFLKWWVSTETQTAYGNELEAILGVAARYTPANIEVLSKLGWSDSDLEVLSTQMKWVKPIPQVPGNYLIGRSLTTSFRSAVTLQNSIQQALTICNKNINDELLRKRKEFNLN